MMRRVVIWSAALWGASLGAQSPAFTRAQADQGAAVYARSCASCHGQRLDDGLALPLAGPQFLARWTGPARSLGDLHRVTRTTMPKNAGRSLPDADYAAVVAYMLERNGYAVSAAPLVASAAIDSLHLAPPTGLAAQPRRLPAPEFVRGPNGLAPTGTGPDQKQLIAPAAGDWLTHTRDFAGTRYSPLTQITAANAPQLRPACVYQVGENVNFQSGPVVYEGVLYLTAGNVTIALDAATCREKWRHTWTQVAAAIPVNNRGVAIKDGRVFRGTMDGYLLALDRATGTLLWARHVGDAAKGETFPMPPLAADSLVFLGPAVGELAIRGWMAAFRADNGAPVWRFNIVPAPGEPGSETWQMKGNLPVGGGAVWTPLSFDADKGLLFVAAANPAPDLPEKLRGGINLYTNSIIALDARTGKLAWYDQMVPNDDHDWDITQVSPLYRATVNGAPRNLVATAGKDGMLRVVDRDSHKRVFEVPVTTRVNADADVTNKGTHACPGVFGGVQWNGPAFHPGTNTLVTPAVDWCATFTLDDTVKFVPGQMYMGGQVSIDSAWGGWITAVDASTGTVRWKHKSDAPVIGAVTSTAGSLIFAGELNGDFLAIDARTGAVRYRFNTGGAIGGGIVTYAVNGAQYVAVASGRPSAFWAKAHPGAPTIVIFSLPTTGRTP
ncbi:MAG: PQQ-binding-like beta-propeller repeat protein [Gemmatimonadetes bacterium]|nr:PQQ-binding-like beta-propeller repeat protein [Gemmatimonadota bacterium]